MIHKEYTQVELARMYQQWAPSRISIRDYSQVVADLVLLSQEATKLVDTSLRIANSIRELVLSLREQG